MQLTRLSTITAVALASTLFLQAEDYVSVEYLQYNENNDRVSVMAPSFSLSMDVGTDYNIKADLVNDSVSGATPTYKDSVSGASGTSGSGNYVYGNQAFNDNRTAGSLLVTRRLENRDELTFGVDVSSESDYESQTGSLEYLHYTDKSHNRAIIAGVGLTFNEIVNRGTDAASGASSDSREESSNSVNLELGLSQVLTQKSAIKVTAFAIGDSGYLTNPHANVVRDYNGANKRLVTEKRPDSRVAYGADVQLATKLLEDVSFLAEYRYYSDDWQITSNTVDSNFYYKLNKSFTFGTGLRYYSQTGASFYNGAIDYFSNQQYASSDERLSAFNAYTYKGSIDFKQTKKLSYNLGIEQYEQSTGLKATSILTGVKYRY